MSGKCRTLAKRSLHWASLAMLLMPSLLAQAGAPPDITEAAVVEAFVDGAVIPVMKAQHSPSGVVAVMKNGQMVFAKGYGYIDVDKRVAVDPKTSLFRPGSISKLFTWVAVMQLVEQGKLDLNADVNQYLKEFQIEDSWPGQPVTLRHIMTHTAGFEDGMLGYVIINDLARVIPLSESLEKYQPERVAPPGERVAYSNWATALAGLIVANVSGTEFNSYVQRNIFDVLGMRNSTFEEPLPPRLDENMAKAYAYLEGQYVELPYEIVSNFGPAGAAAVTAYDMSLFARALLNGGAYEGRRILQTETLQQMLDEGFTHDERLRGMGLGFIKREYGPEGFNNFGHDGGTTVFSSHFGLSQSENFMLFSSFSGPGGGNVHQGLVKAFYDKFFPTSTPAITPPKDFAERAEKYAGNYVSSRSSYTKIEALMRVISGVAVRSMPDGTLMIGGSRYVEVEQNLFREVDDSGRVAFQENASGGITGYVIDGLQIMQFYRAPFFETKGFNAGLLALAVLASLLVLMRLAYQWKYFQSLPHPEKRAEIASILWSASTLFFVLLSAIGLSAGLQELLYEIPLTLKVALVFPILASLAALYHSYQSILVWRGEMFQSGWPRARHTLLSVVGLAMTWFYLYWNLIGFNYYT